MKRTQRKTKKTKEFQLPSIELSSIDWRMMAAVGLLALLILLRFWILSSTQPETNQARRIMRTASDPQVRAVCNEVLQHTFFIDSTFIQEQDTVTHVVLPRNFPFFDFYTILRNKLAVLDAEIQDCQKLNDGNISMAIYKKGKFAERLLFSHSRRMDVKNGTIALVVDDFGYSFNNTVKKFLNLPFPITVSVIPGTAHAKHIAEAAHIKGRQILVHMPMEPLNAKFDDDGYTILADHDGGAISVRIHKAFAEIPFAVGMNNHQGSKVTADNRLMELVMHTLRPMNKFFIDSFTNVHSVAYDVAKSNGILTAQNSFFIDANDETDFIKKQLRRAAEQARTHGSVVAIGHTRPRTLTVLQEMMPELDASGITFVYVSDLIE